MSQFRNLVETILKEAYENQDFKVGDPVLVCDKKYGKILKFYITDKAGRNRYVVGIPKIKIESYQDVNYEFVKSPKLVFDPSIVPDSYLKHATQEDLNKEILKAKQDSGMYANPTLEEDTIKQGNSWTNKGKEGTHGTFKTKKQADAQRKAMFANGYKG